MKKKKPNWFRIATKINSIIIEDIVSRIQTVDNLGHITEEATAIQNELMKIRKRCIQLNLLQNALPDKSET